MPDMEKVRKGLYQHCEGSIFDRCGECPYYEVADEPFQCRDALLMDALALLKEQDAVEPCLMQDAKGIWNTCVKCGHILKSAFLNPMEENNTFFYYPKFCSECGQKVKWK